MNPTEKDPTSEKAKKVMQECIGPHCSYDARSEKTPTGLTWRELQEYRENNIRKFYALNDIFDLTPEMLFDRPIPTHEYYKKITSKPVSNK
tara:strand:- start:1988 stop:2260 length:273 start_codon:yes stop_codon:yes gene_type:complete